MKRTRSQLLDRSAPIYLKDVVNFGPVTLFELESMGIVTFDQLETLGFEETARRWIEHYPQRLNVNAFVAILATLEGISWTQVNENQKMRARNLVNLLRAELHLPPVQTKKKKKQKF